MRILHLTTHLDVGGVTSYLLMVTAGLAQRGHEVWVMSGGGAMVPTLQAAGVPHRQMPLRTKSELHPKLWVAARRIRRVLRSQPVDIIHAHTRVSQVVGSCLARRTGIPLVTTWHGFFRPHWGRRLWPCMGELVIAISPPVERHLREAFHVAPERVALIEHGIPLERFTPPTLEARRTLRREFGIPSEAFVVGAIARLVKDKGIDRLLQAAAALRASHPHLRLLIVGAGREEAALRQLAFSLGIADRVLWLGTQADLVAPLSLMDGFAFPVVGREGFGLVLLEAMAMELPIIATTQPALVHVLDEGRAGLLVPPGDVAALSVALRRLMDDTAFAMQLAVRGAAHVRNMYTLDRMLMQLEAAYGRVLTTRHATTAARRA